MELNIILESVLKLCLKSQCLAARWSSCREIHLNTTLSSLDPSSSENHLHEPWPSKLEILHAGACKTPA